LDHPAGPDAFIHACQLAIGIDRVVRLDQLAGKPP